MPQCTVKGCTKQARRARGRGWCSMHDERWRRFKSLDSQRPTIEERFFSKINTSGGVDACHEWVGARDSKGYGRFSTAPSTNGLATRWLMEHAENRKLKPGEFVLHKCDNPPCLNLKHLYTGDQARNMQDAKERGRFRPWNSDKTECKHGHEFTDENTYIYVEKGSTKRKCRKCINRRNREFRAK